MEQGGLEVPIIVQYTISSNKVQVIKRLKQLINKRWRDPRDFRDNEGYNTSKKVRQ